MVWNPHLKKDKDALERVQGLATRWICSSYSQRASVTSMLSALGLESLEQRREIARLTMMYKTLNCYVAICLDDLDLSFADTRTRANHQFKLKHIYCSTEAFRSSFAPRTSSAWNRLPADTAEADSLSIFKSRIISPK